MGGADVVTLHLQFWFLSLGAVAAVAGLLVPPRPGLAPVAAAPARPRRAALRRAAADAAGGRPRRRLLRRRGPAPRAVAPRPRRLAARARPRCCSPARRCTKREGILFAAVASSPVASASWRTRRGAWPQLAAAALVVGAAAVSVAPLVPGARHPAASAGDLGLGVSADRAVDALDLSLEVLFERRCGRSCHSCPARARRRPRSGATAASPRTSRSSSASAFFRRRLGDVRLRGAPDHGGRGPEPDRALHGLDRRARRRRMPLLLASVWRGAPRTRP